MRNIWTIARRDFKSYFTSPIAYIVISFFLGIMGIMFFNILEWYISESRRALTMGMGKGMGITRGVIQPLYQNMNVVLLFCLPFVTMRLFAEERKNHTIEILFTAPITTLHMVLGKFLSACLLLFIMLGVTSVYPLILFLTSDPEAGPVTLGYLGTFLMGASILAIGTLCSSLTENQIVAGVTAFALSLVFWLLSWFTQSAGSFWGEFLSSLSLVTHYSSFSQGVLNTADVCYYLSFIGIGLYLTHRVLDSYRWR